MATGMSMFKVKRMLRMAANAMAALAVLWGAMAAPLQGGTPPTLERPFQEHYLEVGEEVRMLLPAAVPVAGKTPTYTVKGLPPGLTFNPATRIVAGIPTVAKDVEVTYTVTTPGGSLASKAYFRFPAAVRLLATGEPLPSNARILTPADSAITTTVTLPGSITPVELSAVADGGKTPLWFIFDKFGVQLAWFSGFTASYPFTSGTYTVRFSIAPTPSYAPSSAEITVVVTDPVSPAPVISDFRTNRPTMISGLQNVLLNWTVANAYLVNLHRSVNGTEILPPIDVTNAAMSQYLDLPSQTTTYWLEAIGTVGDPFISPSIEVTVLYRPEIATQPTNQTVITGQTATFSVVATGTAPLSYQWLRNGVAISGATASSYTTPPTTLGDNGALYSVTVTNTILLDTGYANATSSAATLSVLQPPPAPSSPAMSPAVGPVGTPVTLTGANFTGATSVKFNGTTAAFAVVNDTQITTTVPAGATSGPVSVTTPSGTGTSATSFLVSPLPPTFAPGSGPVASSVRLTGANYTGATAVKFNGTAAVFTVDLDTQVTATVPAGATTGPISVTTASGTGTSLTSFTITVGGPSITGFSPGSGTVGTPVTLNGSNFTGATVVAFNGTPATPTFVDDTTITAGVPAGATSGPLSVTTPGGTGTSVDSFTVIPGAPTIDGFSPASGSAGTPVTVDGTDLLGATSVKFNGTSATFTVVNNTRITTTVPVGATTGPLSVTTPTGMGTSAGSFSVLTTDPAITTFSSPFTFLDPGQATTLSWSTVNAATVVMQENGNPAYAINPSGSKVVIPTVTTTYLITATGNGKTVYRHVTVTVRGKMSWKRDIIYLGGKEVGEVDGTGGRSVLTDHLGTPRILVKPDGTVIEQKFAPFGESLTEPAAMSTFAKGFTNHEQTDPSGLIYMQARFYAPMYHRFLSPDPGLDQHFQETQSWNIYSYVQNNPVMATDPTGMYGFKDVMQAAAGIAVGAWQRGSPLYHAYSTYQSVKAAAANPMAYGAAVRAQAGSKESLVSAVSPAAGHVMKVAAALNAPGATPYSVGKPVGAALADIGAAMVPLASAGGGASAARFPGAGDAGLGPFAPAGVPDSYAVVRGGKDAIPSTFSTTVGATEAGAAQMQPRGTIQTSTAGDIRGAGGTVVLETEMMSGRMNYAHANATGGQSTFGPPKPNPVGSQKTRFPNDPK